MTTCPGHCCAEPQRRNNNEAVARPPGPAEHESYISGRPRAVSRCTIIEMDGAGVITEAMVEVIDIETITNNIIGINTEEMKTGTGVTDITTDEVEVVVEEAEVAV